VSQFSRWATYEAAAHVAGPYARAYADAERMAKTAIGGARDVYQGLESIRQDGRRGERMVSAGEWFHGLSDRRAALGELGADFAALQGDLSLHAEAPADLAWVQAVVTPTMSDWQAFASKQEGSALSPWVTEWSVYEQWQERLRRLRELARSRGIQLDSPEPVALPRTIWQRGNSGEGGPLDAAFGLLKTAIFGAIALTGLVAFVVIVRDLRARPHAIELSEHQEERHGR
jgi:hypothetical protein